ncbi:S1C family serine protease [Ectobacillus ponti]|uniref:Trypsin-like peptidase domain-containing protein n=1 Tax=Ectobacillus ponti TaxID=2961894 RepID=A0AA41X937_9BACI|nr:trypsin-like peptidase domain-containing protein [Ectobacillus ponti]MCP8969140.1 trypsin-like peptidase domain-containing protein [Ectobacillus ponti]
MGYYDDTEMSRYEDKKQSSRKGYFFSGLVGAVVGAVGISLAAPYVPVFNQVNQARQVQQTEGTAVPVVQSSKPTDLAGMIQGAKEAVVGVINYQSSDPFSANVQEAGKGSGVIYKKAGSKALIVTNNHVVQGAKQLEVKLDSGKKVTAKLIGTDQLLDLAVVEIDGTDVKKVATLGNSDNVRVGETAIAIGNPLGLEGTVTEGIISSKDREIPVDLDQDGNPDWDAQVLQTDASINPGNSGGALLNANGEVIGINSSKIAQEEVEGIGFAIPINLAKPIMESIEKYGKVQRPFVGVQLRSLGELPNYVVDRLKLPKEITSGVLILQTTLNSPAAKAGLKEYDVITALDNEQIASAAQFRKYLYTKKKIGDTMKITFYRDGQKLEQQVTLESGSN